MARQGTRVAHLSHAGLRGVVADAEKWGAFWDQEVATLLAAGESATGALLEAARWRGRADEARRLLLVPEAPPSEAELRDLAALRAVNARRAEEERRGSERARAFEAERSTPGHRWASGIRDD